MNAKKQKLLQLIHTGVESNIHLAFELAKSQRLCLQKELNGYRRILTQEREDQENYYISPTDLVRLFRLEDITLFFNWNEPQVPSELQYLTKVKRLILFGNKHHSRLPDFVFNFDLLEYLFVHSYNIEFVSSEISKLKQLSVLKLCDCNIKLLPDKLFELTKIYNLDLSLNKLISIPKEIGNLGQLRFLNLSQNPIYKLPTTIYNLRKLNNIFLSNTNLRNNQLFKLMEHFDFITFTSGQPFKWIFTMIQYYFYKLINQK